MAKGKLNKRLSPAMRMKLEALRQAPILNMEGDRDICNVEVRHLPNIAKYVEVEIPEEQDNK